MTSEVKDLIKKSIIYTGNTKQEFQDGSKVNLLIFVF